MVKRRINVNAISFLFVLSKYLLPFSNSIILLTLHAKYIVMDLHVSGIPFKWKDKDLENLFDQYGEVTSAKIIIDKITRQNKGFAFVTMPDDHKAQIAISALDGAEFEGRFIKISRSLPRGEYQKPQRSSPASKKSPIEFKSEKHKKTLPPWLRKEY